MTKINTDHLAKMASEIAATFPSAKNKFKQMSPDDVEQIVNVNQAITQGNIQGVSPELPNFEDKIDLTINTNVFNPDFYTLYGYSLPKNTLYLIIILIIVGVIVWYMTSNTKKNKEKKIIDNDEKIRQY